MPFGLRITAISRWVNGSLENDGTVASSCAQAAQSSSFSSNSDDGSNDSGSSSGEISIDQKDIKSLSLFDLRENISLITQETLLFNESILDNIRYGNMSSSDKEIENIAEISGVSKFANQLPGKLNTVVGESGIKLSGGQRQRIAIARALIKNAPILIMDEATSSLDNLTEKEIQLALDELMKDKTTIIIAHRLSTIQNADVIFTLEKGSIESKGSHEFLLKNSAVYKKLQLQENANEH